MNPLDYLRVEEQAKTCGEWITAVYHSHVGFDVYLSALDLEYATTRARWEPIYEATQIKGDGETHPLLSPNDEFADYETWDQGNLDLSVLKQDEMLQHEYARSALQIGLQQEEALGINPY